MGEILDFAKNEKKYWLGKIDLLTAEESKALDEKISNVWEGGSSRVLFEEKAGLNPNQTTQLSFTELFKELYKQMFPNYLDD